MRLKTIYRFCFAGLISFLFCLGLHLISGQTTTATEPIQTQTISHGEDKAVTQYATGQYQEAIKLWNEALKQTSDKKAKAALYNNLGLAYLKCGNLGQALKEWEEAAKIYRLIKDKESSRLLAQVLTEQGQAYNALGQSRVALPILKSALQLAQNQDLTTEAAASGALGNAYSAQGDWQEARASYKASIEISTKLNNPNLIATGWNNLGNFYQSRYQKYLLQANSAKKEGDDKEEARLINLAKQDAAAVQNAYEHSVQASVTVGGMPQAKALLNLARFLQLQQPPPQDLIKQYQHKAMAILKQVPDSRAKAYALINLAQSQQEKTLKTQNLLSAIATTRNIGDSRAESFALTALGRVYEESLDLAKAMELTQQAQFAAQQVNATDSLYRAQAQMGRIYKATGKIESAIVSYKQAVSSLQSIRGDIALASKDLQFDLRDSAEPVYRELMALLLEKGGAGEVASTRGQKASSLSSQSKIAPLRSKIEEVLQVSELLQLSELQNFFGDECTEVQRPIAHQTNPAANHTAFINSIILNEHTYMILRLPDGSVNTYPVAMSAAELEKTIDRLRFTLEDISTDEYLVEAQKVYDLMIRPMAASLEKAKPNTLVFINDGVLRNVPMTALHDGKQFLIQKYAIATTLSLNTNSLQHSQRDAKAAIFGLSMEIPPFAPLPNVKAETEGVQKILGGKRFLDRDFTLTNLQKVINKAGYSIVHLATHGKFGADSNSTFLQLFDRRVSLPEFETVLRSSKQPIELLTLSACQTAAGDSRATLGIAGVALRAGVQSTLASLWFVNDADTVPLMQNFYTQMRQPGTTKAEALRQAQLKIIADPNGHPAIWSPFVLVGNWL